MVSWGLEAPEGPFSQRPLPFLMIVKGSWGLWRPGGDSKKNPNVWRPPKRLYRVRENMFPEIENLSVRQAKQSIMGKGWAKERQVKAKGRSGMIFLVLY
jgi:hypothetical protein